MIDEAACAVFRATDMRTERYGDVSIERERVTATQAARFPSRQREGLVTKLWIGNRVATSDALGEFTEQYPAIEAATGYVLVHGLGLGAVVRAMLTRPGVEHIDVIENSLSVCLLVSPYFKDEDRVDIWLGDAYEPIFDRMHFWDLVYSDIWMDDDDHAEEHARMVAEYEGLCARHICWSPDPMLP